MMIVVADTSPINYLVLIGEIEVLPRLYHGQILVPPSVYNELKHPRAPDAVRRWINQPPEWLRLCASSLMPDNELLEADIEVGERDAILLAQELAADELIMDDLGGRRVAERRRAYISASFSSNNTATTAEVSTIIAATRVRRTATFHDPLGAFERARTAGRLQATPRQLHLLFPASALSQDALARPQSRHGSVFPPSRAAEPWPAHAPRDL